VIKILYKLELGLMLALINLLQLIEIMGDAQYPLKLFFASCHSKLGNNEIVNLYQCYIFNFREKYL